MLCPEVSNFPSPKVITCCKQSENFEAIESNLKLNNFYRSVIITCPDELQMPDIIENVVRNDSEFYKLIDCSLTEFIEPTFIEYFVNNGELYCLSADRNCIIQNCASITPDGALTLHVLEFIFQTLGLEGIKRPHNFYEIKIDLKDLKHHSKLKQSLNKLETFDFYITWEPSRENVCPSSIAKYFYDRNIEVKLENTVIKNINPTITEIPSIKDVEPEEMTEWIGMLAIGGELDQSETYISTYAQPESEFALKTMRIVLLVAKGFFTPTKVTNICEKISKYVQSRELDHYWCSISIQSCEDSLWQWSRSSVKMFQGQNSSCNVFFTHEGCVMYSVGEIKYS